MQHRADALRTMPPELNGRDAKTFGGTACGALRHAGAAPMSVYKRRSGKWSVLIDLEPTSLGRRRRKAVGCFRTRREPKTAERRALEARDRGFELSPKSATVSQLLDGYLVDREALERSPKTIQEYRGCADRLVRPHLGGVALAKLRPARIAEWVAMLLKCGGKPKKSADGKLVGRSRRNLLITLSRF